MSPRKNLPREVRKGNAPDKGKAKATSAKGTEPVSKNSSKVPDVQAIIKRTREVGKEADQIRFSVDGVKELYDDWVTTRGFHSEKVFSMKGVDNHFPEIITEVKERAWELFTDMTPSTHPLCYFPNIVREFYASYVVWYKI